MRILLISVLLVLSFLTQAQTAEAYFEKIRDNEAMLTAFFSQMPKGGDLHHHYGGSVYAETFLNFAIENDYFINPETLQIANEKPVTGNWVHLSSLKTDGTLPVYKEKLLHIWSVKDFDPTEGPSHQHFFDSFSKFWFAFNGTFEKGLVEIKNRAKSENISYIETMFSIIPCQTRQDDAAKVNAALRRAQKKQDEPKVTLILDSLYTINISKGIKECAQTFNQSVEKLHTSLAIDDNTFTMRYQNFVIRLVEPVLLFENLMTAFESAQSSKLIAGVNIVAPEHTEISMQDYALHMLMFKYCHTKYPTVKYSLHAGELAMGLVKPEELTWHINSAVYTGGANRIGHGCDMPYEKDVYTLLQYMSLNKIPVEINLYSNEFILNLKNDKHPIMLYKAFNVPIIISSDDAGVLRSSLTDQYVLLAKRYKDIRYADIKQFVYNSLTYSFIKDEKVKAALIADLDQRFNKFEGMIVNLKQ